MTQRQTTTVTGNVVEGDLLVAPTMSQGGGASPFAEWAEAVLRGPLEAVERGKAAQEASALAEQGERAAAGELLIDVANTLRTRGFEPAAVLLTERAAHEFAELAEHRERAGDLFLEVTRERLRAGLRDTSSSASKAAECLPPDRAWEAAGLLARARWPAIAPSDSAALDRAADLARNTEQEAEWVAARVELLLISGRSAEAAEAAEAARSRLPLAEGPRLDLELDALDALEQAQGSETSEAPWRQLLDWADDAARRWPGDTGRVWQRRGSALALRDQPEEAQRAFSRAITAWGRLPGHEDQVAEAFFASESVALLHGSFAPLVAGEARTLAAAMRGTRESAATVAEQLEFRGLRKRSGDHLREALAALLAAHNVHRRAGNLRGTLALAESLGELLMAANRPALATASFIEAGKGKQAEEAGRSARPADLAPLLRVNGARWERAATYRVVQKVGRSMPEELVAAWAPRMVEDVERGSPGGLGPDPAKQAVGALATCFLMIPDDLQTEVLELLRQCLTLDPWVSRAVADALSGVTRLALSDETMTLVRGLLHESKLGVVKSDFLAELLPEHPEAQTLLRDAARSGDTDALETLAMAGLIDDGELVERCAARVRPTVESSDYKETTENGVTTVSFGLLPDLAPLGILGRFVAPELRRRLVDSLLAGMQDERLPPTNRYPAGDALFNLVPALDRQEVERCAEILEQLASAPVRNEGPWKEFTEDDPLAVMRFSVPVPEEVRGAALRAFARLVAEHELDGERVSDSINAAFETGGDVAIAAAVDALSRHPKLSSPVPLERFVRHPEVRVRRAALKALWNADGRLPEGEALEALLFDVEPGVRYLLCLVAEEAGYPGAPILGRLSEDQDVCVRTYARTREEHLNS